MLNQLRRPAHTRRTPRPASSGLAFVLVLMLIALVVLVLPVLRTCR
jgi:hypothetical protein